MPKWAESAAAEKQHMRVSCVLHTNCVSECLWTMLYTYVYMYTCTCIMYMCIYCIQNELTERGATPWVGCGGAVGGCC